MNEETINSCLMVAVNLDCPVSLGAIFNDDDLDGNGLELDSHITLLYAQGKRLPKKYILDNLEQQDETLAELYGMFKEGEKIMRPVLDMFELDCFKNDTDYVVLKLKEDTKLYRILKSLNSTLRDTYKIVSDYDYTPHITLAEVKKGSGTKYLSHIGLENVLKESFVYPEDLMISFGADGEADKTQHFLTQYNVLPRYFRIDRLKKFDDALRNEG